MGHAERTYYSLTAPKAGGPGPSTLPSVAGGSFATLFK